MSVVPHRIPKRAAAQIQSLAAVAFARQLGIEPTLAELAASRGVARSTLYRQAHQLLQELHALPQLRTQLQSLQSQNKALSEQLQTLQNRLASGSTAVCELTDEKVALTILELFVRGLSIEGIRASLGILFAPLKPPSVGTIDAIIQQAGNLAFQLIQNPPNIYPLATVEFDELYDAAGNPILVMLEPYSMTVLFLEPCENAKAETWEFAMRYHNIKPPPIMAHDCSAQGLSLVDNLQPWGVELPTSQLCWWHRLRQIRRELQPQLQSLYKKALKTLDEPLWDLIVTLEGKIDELFLLSDPIDHETRQVRRWGVASCALRQAIDQAVRIADQIAGLTGKKLKLKGLEGLKEKAWQYMAHLDRWEWMGKGIEFVQGSAETPWTLFNAHALVYCCQRAMKEAYEAQDNELYWKEQERFLEACEELRWIQAECLNPGVAEQAFRRILRYQTRTSSLTEAVNRRLRGFLRAKRHITSHLLALMQLHHNTTPFSKDAKRAGKSPWQRLGLDVPGLDEGFVGVVKAANQGKPWPSTWAIKR